MLDHAVCEGFLRAEQRRLFLSSGDAEELVSLLAMGATKADREMPLREII
jgi:hypothetical protein